MNTEKFCDEYYMSLIKLQPIYVWGFNMEQITQASINSAYNIYKNVIYDKTYYDNKLKEGLAGSGLGADCSGMIFPISKIDNTAKGYYEACPEKGTISTIDKSHSCLVFRGKSTSQINHIGYYCATNGEVMEMESSKTNFQHRKLDTSKWDYWGKPSFIDYSQSNKSNNPTSETRINTGFQFPCKGIDVSNYQNNLNYAQLQQNGVKFAILKIIDKSRNVDKMFEKHYTGFTQAGIPIFGAYNYSYATTIEQAKADAIKVIEVLNGRKIPIYLDVEDKCQQNLGTKLIDIINAYQGVISGAGLPFGIYTGMSFYNSYLKPYITKLNCKDFWIARYYTGYSAMGIATEPNESYRPAMANIGWQYTSSLVVPGAPGRLDGSILYKNPLNFSEAPKQEIKQEKSSPIGTVTGVTSRLRVRNKPVDGDIVGYLSNGNTVQILEERQGWYRIKENQWVSGEYIKVKE